MKVTTVGTNGEATTRNDHEELSTEVDIDVRFTDHDGVKWAGTVAINFAVGLVEDP